MPHNDHEHFSGRRVSSPELLRKRAAIRAKLEQAALALHQITGRTDQRADEIAALYPDHDHTKAWRAALLALAEFDTESDKAEQSK